MRTGKRSPKGLDQFYEEADILDEIVEEPVEFTLDGELLQEVLAFRGDQGLEGDEVEAAIGAEEELLSPLEVGQERLQEEAVEGFEGLSEGIEVRGGACG